MDLAHQGEGRGLKGELPQVRVVEEALANVAEEAVALLEEMKDVFYSIIGDDGEHVLEYLESDFDDRCLGLDFLTFFKEDREPSDATVLMCIGWFLAVCAHGTENPSGAVTKGIPF
ncbi:hypothetical protein NDU88_001035 [Pleurodeles waltl]|uniref:Uncharacterized protein n=1 Tax=Pleurodeles waltl TaxID=8319 RepID=A0AAV7SAF4_PLEWA|nr:hypothetical protein NDU88_001035 [Pleurodeles waltl]